MKLFTQIASVLTVSTLVSSAAAQIPKLALEARAVLKKHCHACHGEGGTNEGGMNFILSRERLVSSGRVSPGRSKDSDLWKRMILGEMPPEDNLNGQPISQRPSQDDIKIIKDWIDSDAIDFAPPVAERKFISNTEILDFIQKDIQTRPDRERRFLRYFTITHLHNAGLSDDELASYRAGLSKLVNSLSWGRKVEIPEPVDPAQTVFRIDLRDYRWRPSTWDRILEHNPYGLVFDTREARDCYEQTNTEQPFIRADWFVFVASRPPLYHEILELPANARELEKQLHIDIADEIDSEIVVRAGFNGSGVSNNNRLLERHDSPYGAYWISYDFAGNVGRQNLFDHPRGPGESDNLFKHDGGEIIFNLPNGLQGYLLVDAEGNRIDKGPIDIVSDPKQKDRTVVNGVSCMSCHFHGMRAAKDQIRPFVEKNLESFSRAEVDVIRALYAPQKDFDALIAQDTERFRKAVLATGAQFTRTEPVYALAGQFEQALDLTRAASEAGVTPKALLAGLDRSRELGRVFGALRVDGGTIQREVLIEHFGDLTSELLTGSNHRPSATGFNDPDYELGVKLYEGRGERVDKKLAKEGFQKAANRGHVLAKAWLANDRWNGLLGGTANKVDAASLYGELLPDLKKMAERGVADAQEQYGFILWDGIGVTKDEKLGFKWMKKAAEKGALSGQRMVGLCYATGRGVSKDYTEAIKWFRKAAEQNSAVAQVEVALAYALGNGVLKDEKEAAEWFLKAAEQENTFGQKGLAKLYEMGSGVEQDYTEAFKWYRKAGEQGDAEAQNMVGVAFHRGRGVSQDYKEALRWYRKAADQKLAPAQTNIGAMYSQGHGVVKDYTEAAEWFFKAAEQSDAGGQNELGNAYLSGLGVAQDDTEGVKWYRKAAAQNYGWAIANLGFCYANGRGVTRDRAQAAIWLRKAVQNDDPEASKYASELLKQYNLSE